MPIRAWDPKSPHTAAAPPLALTVLLYTDVRTTEVDLSRVQVNVLPLIALDDPNKERIEAHANTITVLVDFGDGQSFETPVAAPVAHVYAEPGTYVVTVTEVASPEVATVVEPQPQTVVIEAAPEPEPEPVVPALTNLQAVWNGGDDTRTNWTVSVESVGNSSIHFTFGNGSEDVAVVDGIASTVHDWGTAGTKTIKGVGDVGGTITIKIDIPTPA